MLAKKFRLPIEDFVGKKGVLSKNPYFLVKIFRPAASFSRFGVTVSTKTSKKAVRRNYLRRLSYDVVDQTLKSLEIGDYWIVVQPAAASLPKEKFVEELAKALKKL